MLYLSFGLGAPTPGIARVPFDSNMRRPADSPGGRKRYTQNRVLLLLVLVGVGDIIEKKKLSIADISAFFKLSTNYRYRKNRFGNYRKIIDIENVHLISSDKPLFATLKLEALSS